MYNVIKNVIDNGNFNLSSIIDKINAQGIKDNLTDEQVEELINLARNKASYKNDIDIYQIILEQDKRIKVLEEKIALLEKGNIDNETEEDSTEEVTYDEYVAGKWYYNGDKVTFNDLIYVCTAPDGQACVWSPTEYPAYWELA